MEGNETVNQTTAVGQQLNAPTPLNMERAAIRHPDGTVMGVTGSAQFVSTKTHQRQPPQPQLIDEKMGNLEHNAIQALPSVVQALFERLEPILSPVGPDPGRESVNLGGAHCAIANRLVNINDCVHNQIDRIEELLNRLQI